MRRRRLRCAGGCSAGGGARLAGVGGVFFFGRGPRGWRLLGRGQGDLGRLFDFRLRGHGQRLLLRRLLAVRLGLHFRRSLLWLPRRGRRRDGRWSSFRTSIRSSSGSGQWLAERWRVSCGPVHSGQRQGETKRGATPGLAVNLDCPSMELHRAERHGQSDSAAVRLGGVVKLEDLLAALGRDAGTGIRDGQSAGFRDSGRSRR